MQAHQQQKQILAAHGLAANRCNAVDYEMFRSAVANINSPIVITRKGCTFIFDQQKNVCALIKPPYFDAQGKCQPVRYFWLEGVKRSALTSRVLQHPRFAAALFQPATQLHAVLQQCYSAARLRWLSRSKNAINTRRGVTVWTTMRLTT